MVKATRVNVKNYAAGFFVYILSPLCLPCNKNTSVSELVENVDVTIFNLPGLPWTRLLFPQSAQLTHRH